MKGQNAEHRVKRVSDWFLCFARCLRLKREVNA